MSLNEGKGELMDVDLAPKGRDGSHFFIEGASKASYYITLLLMAAFFAMHFYSVYNTPPSIIQKEEFFELNTTVDKSIEIDVTLSQIQDLHRFVQVNASLVRADPTSEKSQQFSSTTTITFLQNYNTLSSEKDDNKTYIIKFEAGSNKSTFFPVLQKSTIPKNCDSIRLEITTESDFTGIKGFDFTWAFANPSADKYFDSAKLLMSFLIGYMLVVFLFYLKFDAESFTQIFIIIMGVAGIMFSNPLTFISPTSAGIRFASNILESVFLNIYKIFLFVELELLRSHSNTPKTAFTVVISIIFGVFSMIEAAASNDRTVLMQTTSSVVNAALPTERAMAGINSIVSLALIAFFIVAAIQNQGTNPRRLVLFGVAVFTTAITSLITQVYFPLAGLFTTTYAPSLLYISTCVTNAAFEIFMLHCGSGIEYDKMDSLKDDQQPMVIDIEQITDDDNDDDDDEEDDEEEEEEEE